MSSANKLLNIIKNFQRAWFIFIEIKFHRIAQTAEYNKTYVASEASTSNLTTLNSIDAWDTIVEIAHRNEDTITIK